MHERAVDGARWEPCVSVRVALCHPHFGGLGGGCERKLLEVEWAAVAVAALRQKACICEPVPGDWRSAGARDGGGHSSVLL